MTEEFEAVVAYFKTLSGHLPGVTAENHKKSVRTAGVPAEIRIEHLSNTSLEAPPLH
jgi:hypothetical protein